MPAGGGVSLWCGLRLVSWHEGSWRVCARDIDSQI